MKRARLKPAPPDAATRRLVRDLKLTLLLSAIIGFSLELAAAVISVPWPREDTALMFSAFVVFSAGVNACALGWQFDSHRRLGIARRLSQDAAPERTVRDGDS